MKRQGFLVGIVAVMLLSGMVVGLSLAQGLGGSQSLSQAMQPQGAVSITAAIGSKFSYQGVLKESGALVTGSRDMTFRLYSDGTCTTQVGSDIVKSGVAVSDGLFSVELTVNQADFNGQGLWLETDIGGARVGCQEILPVPYALSLRPGAIISDTSSRLELNQLDQTFVGSPPTITQYKYGIRAGAIGAYDGVVGLHGEANNTGAGYAYGLAGYASATTGTPIGVYGWSSTGHGVYGETHGDWGWRSGVYGLASQDHAHGVTGWNSGGGPGVYGYSETGAALYAAGDASQYRTGNGLVKAGVYGYCGDDVQGGITRSFNNVGGTISMPAVSLGYCTIDFGFQVSDRFWVATVAEDSTGSVACYSISSNQLRCRFTGNMMVLIY